MRVALVVEQVLAPVPGGTGRWTVELAAGLARTAALGDSVSSWTAWHRDPTRAEIPGVDGPHRLPLPRRGLIAAWERGFGPRPRSCDVVHAPTLMLPPRGPRPLVVTIHDTVPWTHPQTLTPRGARWHRAMAGRAARSADAIVVPTQAVANELTGYLPGLRADRVHVLGGGIAAVFLTGPDPDTVRSVTERYSLPPHYLLSLATLEPRKGLDLLIAALARLGASAVPLLVVGQAGWGSVDLAALLRQHRLGPAAVRVLGHVPDADLAVILRQATALVMPSRAEGFGLPVAEAMAVGTAVLCTDVPALVEVAGDAALVVTRDDVPALTAGLQQIADADLRAHLIRVGQARAPRFSWDDVARRAWRLYTDLTAG